MRYLLPPEEVKALVEHIDDIDAYSCDNDRERDSHCRELINSGDTRNWIQVIKSLYCQKQRKNEKGKDLSQQEQRLFKTAEKLFYSEIAYALNIPFNEVGEYIARSVQGNATA